jgi:hypothetical protein
MEGAVRSGLSAVITLHDRLGGGAEAEVNAVPEVSTADYEREVRS